MGKPQRSELPRNGPVKYSPILLKNVNSSVNISELCDDHISKLRRVLPQLIAVSIQNLLQFGYGMTQGYPTIAIPAIQKSTYNNESSITLNDEEISWMSSINFVSMPLGCLFSGMFAQLFGNRLAMQLINIPMLAAWLLFYFATCKEYMYLALCLIGIGGGLMEAPVITYVAEITEPTYRGIFSVLATTCVSLGVFTQFILGSMLDWRTIALMSTSIPLLSVLMLSFVPESPVWLIKGHKLTDALKSLQWLRGWVEEHKVENEFNQLYAELITKKASETTTKNDNSNLLSRTLKRKLHLWEKRSFIVPFLLVLLTFFICHFSGKTPLRTYAIPIFATLKTAMDKNIATILFGTSELLATILGAGLIHFTGKRPLVFTSMMGTGVSILGIAIYAYFLNISDLIGTMAHNELRNNSIGNSTNRSEGFIRDILITTTSQPHPQKPSELMGYHNYMAWIPLILVLNAGFCANLGIRMIPWILIGEIFPADIRKTASAFAGCIGYFFGFLANKLFIQIIRLVTFPGAFAFYASVSFIGIIILYFTLPETEGRTLGEIEGHFSKKSSINLMRKKKDEDSFFIRTHNYFFYDNVCDKEILSR